MMARTFEMQDCRRLREVKGLEAAEPGAWAAFPWAQLFTGCLLLSGLWGDVVYHKALPRGLGTSWGLRGLGEDGRQRPGKVHGGKGNRWRKPALHIRALPPAWQRSSERAGQCPWTHTEA